MSVTLYGIKNCDTMKKARKWLDENNLDYDFHDYRVNGIEESLIIDAFKQLDWQLVVNKRGTTYRNLTEEQKQQLNSENAIPLLMEHPAMIKRPLLCVNGTYHLGFKAATYQDIFK